MTRIKEFRLYHWYSGVDDEVHRFVKKFKTLEELIDFHKTLRPKSSLYNYKAHGNDYYKEVEELIPDQCTCVYIGDGSRKEV